MQNTDSKTGTSFKNTEKGKKTAILIVNARIPDGAERSQESLEALAECDWLTEQEEYTNPHGVRMIRGFVLNKGIRERRYYIEYPGGLMMIRMSEDERYYSVKDCEEAMQATADSVRPIQ